MVGLIINFDAIVHLTASARNADAIEEFDANFRYVIINNMLVDFIIKK